ncbi:preprotein translocase subunit YidC [Sanguibacter keddieii DSM 10542]|uniref:Membrane protein insertase YidC n=1 Tax=Sanguibacter keddieii (strain ATCC 51767 / DSM 10542 / NCFB 3025 / ST-74) TaxID=446469 RepID=D1BGU8_SANKS|nr:membrane protein insertase YidC [Sanguibacter keddieii]ACZ23686.1 preprotein translocase subunit YidC [Sanguibacter keddieii DSM 10542]
MMQILYPLEWAVAWIMFLCHKLFVFIGLPDGAGVAWILSIVGLVIVIRTIMIPLFFKQIRASRGMQMVQPELQAIQKKYKNKKDPASREAMSRETMALYKKHGTNPFASCLPVLLQAPVFFALFRVLNSLRGIADGTKSGIGPIDQAVAQAAETSSLFGAPLSSTFLHEPTDLNTKIVAGVLIVSMAATQFLTQRQLTMKNMPKAALEGPMMQTQKIMLYMLPVIMAVSGVNFPVGVLIYWTTTNLWSMGQQFYTIRKMPAPGSEAERLLNERKARKAARKGIVIEEDKPTVIEQPRGQRQQPKRKDRQKARPAGTAPVVGASASTPSSTEPSAPEDSSATSESPAPKAASTQRQQPQGKKRKKR